MRFCLLTNFVSPHQMPLAQCLAERLGRDNFRYVTTEPVHAERAALGWDAQEDAAWLLTPDSTSGLSADAKEWIEQADILLCGNRDFDLFRRRVSAQRITLYCSERWFKPPYGLLRLCHPSYLRMGLRFCHLLGSPYFYYLPMGYHAAEDARRMMKFISLLTLRMSKISPCPAPDAPRATHHVQPKLLLWGYIVGPSTPLPQPRRRQGAFRVLWVGRMLNWKRVDTLIKAVGLLCKEGRNVHLTMVGQGPDEPRLHKLADTVNKQQSASDSPGSTRPPPLTAYGSPVTFMAPVPIVQVRELMRQSDVYVLPSNGSEGWGVAVNEAMLEGCAVIATREAGSARTLIQDGVNGLLFRTGHEKDLARIMARLESDDCLRQRIAEAGQLSVLAEWTPAVVADRLLEMVKALIEGQRFTGYPCGPLTSAEACVKDKASFL